MKNISVATSAREMMIDITSKVAALVPDGEGVVVCFVQHTTCGLTVNENADPDVQTDMLAWLRHVVPQFPAGDSDVENHPVGKTPTPLLRKEGSLVFKHFEHNSDAHIKSSLMGSRVTVPFENGRLCLGRWQGIYLCEFDGPRERKVVVQVILSGST